MVGNPKPGKAFVGYPDTSRNTETKKYVGAMKQGIDPIERYIPVGKHLLINNYRSWGRRVVSGKAVKDSNSQELHLEFNDPKYRGEIEFLTWGDHRGFAIECRYLKQSQSLDVEYQDNVQKIKIDKDKGPAQIELDAGENKFDRKKDALFIKHLQHHPQNRDSPSKNPNPEIKGHVFYEVTDEQVDTGSIDLMESGLEAGSIVKTMSTKPDMFRNLFEIMGKRPEFEDVTELSNDKEIYKVLLKFSQANPTEFFLILNDFRESVLDGFKKAESYNILDLTKDGHIGLDVSGKKNVLLSDVEGKGKEMIEYVINNYTDNDVYKAIKQLKEVVSKLK